MRDVVAPNFVAHLPRVPGPLDIAGNVQVAEVFVNAFPDGRVAVDDEIAEGGTVATRWTFRGTHTSDFQGIPPTGKQVTMTGIDINRIAGGKIVEHWSQFDGLGLMQQLGVIPPPEHGADRRSMAVAANPPTDWQGAAEYSLQRTGGRVRFVVLSSA